MADHPLADHNNRTPLELAHTPAMDQVTRLGLAGLFCPIPEGLAPGSDIGNLSLFGYNPRDTFTGRAPLEAASRGIVLGPDQVAFRCNLVTLQDGAMRDFTAGHISTKEAAALIEALNANLADAFAASFYAGVSYRHLTIFTSRDAANHSFEHLTCTPPHDITGQPYAPHLPQGPGAEVIRNLMCRSESILAGHPINTARIAAGRLPATSIWLWGQGRPPSIEPYQARFGARGTVISAVDLVNGIASYAGLDVVHVPGATGYLDTNYAGKVQAALAALERTDFVYLHVEAPDEASHEGRADLKVQAIEAFDARVVAPCLAHIRARSDARLLVTPDHVTAISTRTHASGPVPFALCGAGVAPDTSVAYSERHAEETGLYIAEGYALVPHLLRTPALSASSLKQQFQKWQTPPIGAENPAPEKP